jgi:DNA-directed RNA polymerase specialized sigma24 family protein
MTFARYFRQGQHSPTRGQPRLNLVGIQRRVQRRRRCVTPRGVDLAQRGVEVAKLLRAACGQAIQGYGYDFDDVLQEVYQGLLRRNRGPGAFNPERASFGYYITMVCRCVFSNYHAREQRRRSRETYGGWDYQDGAWSPVDAGDMASCDPLDSVDLELVEVGECMTDLSDFIADQDEAWRQDATLYQDARLAREVLPLVYAGKRRGEIAAELGISAPAIGRALSYLRGVTREWVSLRVLH